MIGTRLPDGQAPKRPGEYSWMPYSDWVHKPRFFTGEGEWQICAPVAPLQIGAFGRATRDEPTPVHSIEIHEDRTITVTPSLVFHSGWHGWLRRGVFSSA